jgi:hypothetical protein
MPEINSDIFTRFYNSVGALVNVIETIEFNLSTKNQALTERARNDLPKHEAALADLRAI